MERLTGSILLLFFISSTYANTSPSINNVVYDVCEDIPIGEVAFAIAASDAEGDPLTFSLTGSNIAYFTVNRETGEVTVKQHLDRENDNVMTLGVVVSDGRNTISGELTIILLDANDNRPVFQKASYDVEIPENTAVGTSLFRVLATDSDTGNAGVVHYSIDEVTPSSGISLFSIVNTTGEVRLMGRLNYTALSTFYRLKINATDGGGKCFNETEYFSSIVFSFITVVDVPDLDPQFVGLPYIPSVKENSLPGLSVFQVTAIDQDTGLNYDIIYSIQDSSPDGLFKISEDDGVITVLSELDREVIGDMVILTVKATEAKENIHGVQASTTTEVQISIMDENDNKPEFYKCGDSAGELSCEKTSHFTGDVMEHSLGSIPINMTVKDADKFSSTELLLEGPNKDVFSVQPQFTMSDSIVQVLVKNSQLLDYENTQQMDLLVVAIDQEETSYRSTATVTINIKDINDHSPMFPHDTYKLEVAEGSPNGTIVANITAEDPDTMDQDKLIYTLLPESIRLYFDVEPHTGTIYVKNETLLDREVRSLYSATLQARDTDGKPGTAVLEITLTDINDNAPVFNRDSYLVFVKEGGQVEVTIEATDADEPNTVNSQIVYEIQPGRYSGNFTINPDTGVLRNRGELDLEALDPELNGKIQLNITATDKGSPSLSSVVAVIINVEDINDNKPQFNDPLYEFYVKEGEKGAFVGSVHAVDLDQTAEFNRISFSITDGSFGNFIIRTFKDGRGYTGNITVDPDVELDYESVHKQFLLTVEAADLEQKKDDVKVAVHVVDVNDERPEFRPIEPTTVTENTTITEPVGVFTGYDKDGNHSLVYKLESVKCRCAGAMSPCNWFVLDSTGEVRVNPEFTVDYEECDQAVVEAWVVDERTEKGENNSIATGEMIINIKDINDNPPEFIPSDSVFVVVSESASKGTSVAKVTATDRDTGINAQIEFKVTAVQFVASNYTSNMRMLFEAVTTQQKDVYVGIIQATEKLDLSLKGKYLLTVTATDTGGLHRNTMLDIFTVDESYQVKLQFTRTVEEVEANQNTIIRALTDATKASVDIVSISSNTAEASRNPPITTMLAYFVYSNGTAITPHEVEKMVEHEEHYPVLAGLGLRYIGKAPVTETVVDTMKFVLAGIVGGLIIVLGVLTTSLLCTRRNYKRKLKAAKAMNSASMVTSDNQKGGAVVPGTNMYTMEGANPVLNLNIDTTIDLDLDEESSDVDKVSLNSLDYSDDTNNSARNSNPLMRTEAEDEDSEPPGYTEPLGAALAQRGQMKDKPHVGFDNTAFSTTDL